VLNLDDVVIQPPAHARPPQGATAGRYDLRRGEIATRIGARKLGYRLTVVAPDKRSCPFHSHHEEERCSSSSRAAANFATATGATP
jgi:uncharacterized cupin superfamily protein